MVQPLDLLRYTDSTKDVLTPDTVGMQREQDAAFAKGLRSDSPHQVRSSHLPSRPAPGGTISSASATRAGVVSTVKASDVQPKASKHASITASDPHHSVIKDAFSRASNIIRESIEVEGVLFLDASIGSFGGLIYGHKPRDSSESGGSPPCSNEDQLRSSSPPSSEDQPHICDVLGFSTGQASSIDGATLSVEQVPERLLNVLLRRYPAGKIFNFDLGPCFQFFLSLHPLRLCGTLQPVSGIIYCKLQVPGSPSRLLDV